MVIGACRVALLLPSNDSLKGKRAVVRRVLDRVRQRFPVSAAEVDDLDVHRRATLGFAVVSNDPVLARGILERVAREVEVASEARMSDCEFEVVPFGDSLTFGAHESTRGAP